MSQNDIAAQPSVFALKAKYEELKTSGMTAAMALQELMPVTGRSFAAQEAFFLAFTDCRRLQALIKQTEGFVNALALLDLPEDRQATNDFEGLVLELAKGAKSMVDEVVEGLGVSEEVVMTALIKDFAIQVAAIEAIVERIQANAKIVTA